MSNRVCGLAGEEHGSIDGVLSVANARGTTASKPFAPLEERNRGEFALLA
jgi:hypothetical protein